MLLYVFKSSKNVGLIPIYMLGKLRISWYCS